MSETVFFKQIPTELLTSLQDSISENEEQARQACRQMEEATSLARICHDCDGEVFSMLFDYLESEVCPELREGGSYADLLAFWEEDCDAMDLILMTPEMITKIRSMFQSLDLDIPGLIEDFSLEWACDSASVCTALQTLMENIQSAGQDALLFIQE